MLLLKKLICGHADFSVEELKKLPASKVAVKYYTEGDLYLFGKLDFSAFICIQI